MSDTKYSVKSGFYDAINHDRLYSADDMNQPYKSMLSAGIIEGGFEVTPQSTPDMTVNVAAGHALLGDKWVDAAAKTLTVPENTALYGRIDAVVLRVDINTGVRAADLIYRTGTPASEPEAPALIGTTGIYEVRLANITVAAGATAIAAAQISDQRGTSGCPYVTMTVGNTQIKAAVEDVLEEHPEWTTTVQDGSITLAKLASGVIDNTLTQAGAAADAKATGDAITALNNDLGDISSLTTEDKDSAVDAINELNEKKANTNGSYDDMTVGGAKQLLSNVYETESAPYIFRASGGSLEIGDREQDTLVGMDLVWNQLIADANQSASLTLSPSAYYATKQNGFVGKANHVYFVSADFTYTGSLSVAQPFFQLVASNAFAMFSALTSGVKKRCSALIKATTNETALSIIGISTRDSAVKFIDGDTASYENYNACDITAMFGSTIADYIYSLETGTAGAGVSWLKRYLTKEHYAFSMPTMTNGVASSHETVGFNQFDVSTSVDGERWYTTGTVASSGTTRSDYIKCFPNTQYYAKNVHGYANMSAVFWFDSDKNYISASSIDGSSPASGIVTSPANACYMGVNMPTTSKDSVCVNMHYDGERDGEYEPYIKHSYPLDDTVDLHGIPMKDESGNLYADGDTCEADGTVTRRYGVVDLGSLDYELSGNNVFITRATLGAKSRGQAFLCTDYLNSGYVGSGDMGDMTAQLLPDSLGSGSLWLKNTSYSDATAFKTAMNGVKLVYELATPTTESAEPFQTPQIVDNWGTEEYVTDGVIPIGHTTKYPVNLRSKIEVEPNSPTSDGVYLMQRENGENTYVPFVKELPTLPSENGETYLKCTVSGGTKTLSWSSLS